MRYATACTLRISLNKLLCSSSSSEPISVKRVCVTKIVQSNVTVIAKLKILFSREGLASTGLRANLTCHQFYKYNFIRKKVHLFMYLLWLISHSNGNRDYLASKA